MATCLSYNLKIKQDKLLFLLVSAETGLRQIVSVLLYAPYCLEDIFNVQKILVDQTYTVWLSISFFMSGFREFDVVMSIFLPNNFAR